MAVWTSDMISPAFGATAVKPRISSALVADKRLHEAARFRQGPCAKHRLHRQLRHAVGATRRDRFVFVKSDSGYFRIGEKAERYQAIAACFESHREGWPVQCGSRPQRYA